MQRQVSEWFEGTRKKAKVRVRIFFGTTLGRRRFFVFKWGVLPKSIALVVVLLNTKFEISRQPKWYLPKAQRIWAWGTAPLRNPMSFWKVPF